MPAMSGKDVNGQNGSNRSNGKTYFRNTEVDQYKITGRANTKKKRRVTSNLNRFHGGAKRRITKGG
jgi:hypothetical protein